MLTVKPVGKTHKKVLGLWLCSLLIVVFLGGCASNTTTSFVNENVSFGYIEKIAVLPFENHTQDSYAGERVRDIVSTEILSRGLFDVVEKGDLERFLREEMVVREHYSLDQATSKRLMPRLNVQAYLAGSVDDFSEVRNGSYSYPVVAVTLRLVDSEAGKIIWQASGHESCYSSTDRLFGFASDNANQVTFRLARRLMNTLAGE